MERHRIMVEVDKLDWNKFKTEVKHSLNQKQFELVCQLHSKYFNHNYYKPCTCSPAIIKQWIAQIDELYETN